MLPDEDRLGATVNQLKTRLTIFMGGRAAEELSLEEFSTGASNDLAQATRIARAMITEYGMSEALGPVGLNGGNEVFLGRDFGRKQDYSEATAAKVDSEIKRLCDTAYRQARTILSANMHILDHLAEVLLERETVDGIEFEEVVTGMNPVLPTTA